MPRLVVVVGPLLTTKVSTESFFTDEFGPGRVSITELPGTAGSLRRWILTLRPACSASFCASTSFLPMRLGTCVSPLRNKVYIVTIALRKNARASTITIPNLRERVQAILLGWR